MAVTAPTPRDSVKVVSVVSSAHFFSHFFQIGLPPLFPLLKDAYGVSYVELALLVSVMFVASGVGQVITGFLVDRYGARPLLIGGAGLMSGSFALLAFFPTYEAALVLMLLVGLGNSVFHPADFAIFQAAVAKPYLGRAFSMHSFTGNIGWAAAPFVMGGLAALVDWRFAVLVAGLAGLAVTAAVIAFRHVLIDDTRAGVAEARAPTSMAQDVRLLLSPAILACFGFFLMIAITLIAFNTFAVTLFSEFYGFSLVVANGLLTAFLVGFIAGILPGGVLADRIDNHDKLTALAFGLGGVLIFIAGNATLPAVGVGALLAVGGFVFGSVMPSRDMIVRKVTPEGSTGKVFGFVYSALDVGGAIAPVAFGWLLVIGHPELVFSAVAGALIFAGLSALLARALMTPRLVAGE